MTKTLVGTPDPDDDIPDEWVKALFGEPTTDSIIAEMEKQFEEDE